MCGIVAGVSKKIDVADQLLEGLKRLEYRGYDSAGMACINSSGSIERVRTCGKVGFLAKKLSEQPLSGMIGVAHTRWATHGKPSEKNAHPHLSGDDIAVVHNGIIENHHALTEQLKNEGYEFQSETDTEVIVHCLHSYMKETGDLLSAARRTLASLQGAYALVIISKDNPGQLIAMRRGSPLVIGICDSGHYVASDPLALLPVTQDFCVLEEGDLAVISADDFSVYDNTGEPILRKASRISVRLETSEKGAFKHFMQKEIFEQPFALSEAMEGRVSQGDVLDDVFGKNAKSIFDATKQIQIVACGTSYHAGLVAKYWLESISGVACQVDIASEYRYRSPVVQPGTLLVLISQSGETADTLAVLKHIKSDNFVGTLSICNVPTSSLVRDTELSFLTHAGPEIGVASTKAFTSQLVSLLFLTYVIGKRFDLTPEIGEEIIEQMRTIPDMIEKVLALDSEVERMAAGLAKSQSVLFLGRGAFYPIAMEGALKLKELSYIHAESYPAGELKHGPLALVDDELPVVALLPNNAMMPKMLSNLQEIVARGGNLYLFADESVELPNNMQAEVVRLKSANEIISPLLYTIPLQLLAYYIAVAKGTDVDQPRNLAKSVTVE